MTDQSFIPADVPSDQIETFKENFEKATNGSNRLMLFAGDQKVEHLNSDFFGKGISPDDANPIHLFQIASGARIGVFATQMGLVSRYAKQYAQIPFLIKLNSKTNLVPFKQKDPLSKAWYTVEQVVAFSKQTGLNVLGVGYTVYLGSEYEAEMLHEAAQIVYLAHQYGLITVLWMYPKGKAVADEHDVDLIAGAAGVGACLGADFVKLKVPYENKVFKPSLIREVVAAAGKTGVLCEGGSREDPKQFLTELFQQIHEGARGSGTGRNIHQRDIRKAIKMANAIYAITTEGKSIEEAEELLKAD